MLPIFRNKIKPWFAEFGATLTDRSSFRWMIGAARAEIGALKAVMPAYAKAGFDDILADCDRDIAEAEEVINLMEQRLSVLERRKS